VKTISIKKRIALGTVVAVAAGLLTTVAASTANAAAATWSDGSSQLVQWLSNDASGAPSLGNSSVGIVGTAFTAQTGTAAASGVMLASGRLAINVQIANGVARDTYVVTGGQIINSAAVQPGTSGTVATTVNTDGTKLDVNESVLGVGTLGGAQLIIAPTVAAGGTITIVRYTGVSTQYGANASPTFKASVSVAAASAAGTVSTAKSYAYIDAYPTAGTNAYDEPTGFTIPNGKTQTIRFGVYDAYGVGATGNYLTYSSDNCNVGLSSYTTSKSGIDTATASTSPYGAGTLYVSQAVANTATTCVVTISYGSTVIGTKTIKFLGDIASITATAGGVENQGGTGNVAAGLLSITYKDAAGNVVPGSNPSVDSGANAYVTSLDAYTYDLTNVPRAVAGKGAVGAWVCGGSTGSASFVFKTTNAAGATIKSAPVTLACGATADTYTMATDKTSYATGDIATITITFKDAKGGVPNDVSVFSPVNIVASGAFTGLVTAATTSDTSTNGVLTYKAIVGQVAGTFPVVVSVPSVNTGGHGKDQSATITVTSSTTDSVSKLVEVVGTLLASFTKQISALIKALSVAKKK